MINKDNNKKVSILSGVLGTLAVIVGVVAYVLLSSLFNRLFVGFHLGNDASCALLSLSIIGITVAFILYELIFIAWIFKKAKAGEDVAQRNKLNRLFILVLIVCISLSLIFAIFSANTFTRCDEKSISKVCFVTTREYRWDNRDIIRYSLTCSPEGTLEFSIAMRDGEVINLFSSVNSCSQGFIDKYENLYGYAAYLDKEFKECGYIIDSRIDGVEYMEKYYKDTYPEIWKYLEPIIENN